MSGLSCLFAPGDCINSVVGAWLAWWPFGRDGFVFTCGMIVGAILGRLGVAAVIALLVAIRSAPGKPVPNDEVWPHPDQPVKPKKRKYLLDGLWKK